MESNNLFVWKNTQGVKNTQHNVNIKYLCHYKFMIKKKHDKVNLRSLDKIKWQSCNKLALLLFI